MCSECFRTCVFDFAKKKKKKRRRRRRKKGTRGKELDELTRKSAAGTRFLSRTKERSGERARSRARDIV